MSDGCHIKVTNRVKDFPSWFELHPTEVADTIVFKERAALLLEQTLIGAGV